MTAVTQHSYSLVQRIFPSENYSIEVLKATNDISPLMMGVTVFVLAVFIGYYVVWRVTPALHSPLMAVTNAISSVIIVGALFVTGIEGMDISKIMGFIAITLASINIFGGFIVTNRMLQMFKRKKEKKSQSSER